MRIAAVASCPDSPAHALLAAGALRRAAALGGHAIRVETRGAGGAAAAGPDGALTAADLDDAEVVVLAGDPAVDPAPFAGRPVLAAPVSEAILHPGRVLERARALLRVPFAAPDGAAASGNGPARGAPTPNAVMPSVPPAEPNGAKRLVAVTACPTGIAHTFLAAEALQKAARALGHTIAVETQGSVGAGNPLTPDDIARADAVVIAADTGVDLSRFAGKPVYVTGTKEALRAGQAVVRTALERPAAPAASGAPTAAARLGARPAQRAGAYRHLMTGVSYMLPVVIAGGLAIALAFALGGISAGTQEGTLAAALQRVGGAAFQLFVPVLAAYIAQSIADRPGIAPGLVGGLLAQTLGAGFLGGIAAGFLAGHLTKRLATGIRLPPTLEGLKPVLLLPLLSTLSVGLLVIYAVAPPAHALNRAIEGWLLGMRGANAALLGVVLGAMMAADLGGPINKAAYTFAVGLLASRIPGPMAAVMAAGMTPPLGLALASLVFRDRFDAEERKAGAPALVLGLSFISEGAIPFAAKDPIRVLPALIAGSAATGALSMAAGVALQVPHGGVFAALIPGAVTHLVAYLGAILAGTVVTAALLFALKRPLAAAAPETAPEA